MDFGSKDLWSLVRVDTHADHLTTPGLGASQIARLP
jgi:hypothetical protein